MLLTLLGTAFSSILAGGATGLGGVIIQRFFDWMNAKTNLQKDKQDHDFQLSLKDKDAEIMDKEWAGRLRVAEREGQTAESVAESASFAASMFKEPERYSSSAALTWGQNWLLVIVDAFRGSIRPLLTAYLCALTTYVWYEVHLKLQLEDLDQSQALEIWKMVVGTILYLTTTCILWWFGTRNKQSAPSLKLK